MDFSHWHSRLIDPYTHNITDFISKKLKWKLKKKFTMVDNGSYPGILDCQGRENGLYPKVMSIESLDIQSLNFPIGI